VHTRTPLHAVTWLIWALAAAFTVQLAPSPVYVAIVIGVCALVVELHAPRTAFSRAFPVILGLAVAFGLFRVVLTALTSHGIGAVWFALPSFQLPTVLGGFTVGGSIEGPVVLQAAAEAFVIVGVIAAFGAFNACASHYELVQSAPRAFHELGLVVTVGIAFVPSTILSIQAAREADRARTGGRVVRRGRLLRLVIPVLESGLERAVALAESMDSRGFARSTAAREEQVSAWCGLGALVALGGAFIALVGRADAAALGLSIAGSTLLVLAVFLASRATERVRYRPRPLTGADWFVRGISLLAPIAVGIAALADDSSLTWVAQPLAWPSVSVLPLIGTLFLLAPMLVRPAPADAGSPGVGSVGDGAFATVAAAPASADARPLIGVKPE
jgi:energy-coupling factor transport system permease protein